jgi:predicted esterase
MTENLSFIHRFEPGPSDATLLALHGTGGDENDLIGLARDLAPTANLLSPRGKVLENGAPRFFRRLAMGVFDLEDLRAQAADLASFIQAAGEKYRLDTGKVYALGYSNGANIAAALLLLHPQTLAGGVLLRAMMPIEPEKPPDLSGKPVFIAAGSHDPMIPRASVETLAQRLRQAGADLELRWQQGGHQLYPAELEVAREWLEAHL